MQYKFSLVTILYNEWNLMTTLVDLFVEFYDFSK